MFFKNPLSRRSFLVASAAGLNSAASLSSQAAGKALGASSGSGLAGGGRAKSTILFFLCGGASHIDMWDLKPKAPAEFRGEFLPVATSAAGVRLSEHLPLLSRQAHHLAVVNSVDGKVNNNDHHAGYYHNLTGHIPDRTFLTLRNNRKPYPDDWPYMGSVVSAKRPVQSELPGAITLPYKPSRPPYTRPGQFAARLGVQYDPLYVHGSHESPLEFQAPALVLDGDVTPDRLTARKGLLGRIDQTRREFEQFESVQTWSSQQERAISLLLSSKTTTAFDLASESPERRARYGETLNGMSLLLARRLVEAGVPFVTVFWQASSNPKLPRKCRTSSGWDTHGDNFNKLKDCLLPEFDRCYSALIEDLDDCGLLDETLLLVTSEMGRKPKIGDPRSGGVSGAGRDHWTYCLTDLLAGGGIRGGQTYGSSDRHAEYPLEKRVTPAHIAHSVYHAMGVTDLQAYDQQDRPYHLLDRGEPIRELF